MLTYVDADKRIQWEVYSVVDDFAARFKQAKSSIGLSNKMMAVLLSRYEYRGFRYLDGSTYKIGYGYGDPTVVQGMTEDEAFAEWYGAIKNIEKNIVAQLPLTSIPQSVFDALFGLYLDTGTWRTVQSDDGTYNMLNAVRNANWLLIADILSRGKKNNGLRMQEAHIAKLADYVSTKTREQLSTAGLRYTRTSYANLTNELEKQQAEYSYYRQLGSFLPGMSDLRKRRIVALAK